MKTVCKNLYQVVCCDKDGNVKWEEPIFNTVVNEGLDDVLAKYFKGSSYTASHYIGLKLAGTIAAADTLSSHAGWTEASNYSGDRKALTLGSVSSQSVDNSASRAVFTFTGSATIAGVFICTSETGTGGILYGAADFSSSRDVVSTDVLNVTCTLTQGNA